MSLFPFKSRLLRSMAVVLPLFGVGAVVDSSESQAASRGDVQQLNDDFAEKNCTVYAQRARTNMSGTMYEECMSDFQTPVERMATVLSKGARDTGQAGAMLRDAERQYHDSFESSVVEPADTAGLNRALHETAVQTCAGQRQVSQNACVDALKRDYITQPYSAYTGIDVTLGEVRMIAPLAPVPVAKAQTPPAKAVVLPPPPAPKIVTVEETLKSIAAVPDKAKANELKAMFNMRVNSCNNGGAAFGQTIKDCVNEATFYFAGQAVRAGAPQGPSR